MHIGREGEMLSALWHAQTVMKDNSRVVYCSFFPFCPDWQDEPRIGTKKVPIQRQTMIEKG